MDEIPLLKCPCCGKRVRKNHFACQFASKGGKAASGEKKARSSEQARKAVRARWDKEKKEKL